MSEREDRAERAFRTTQWLEDPDTMDVIAAHVANGGSLLELCSQKDVRYSDAVLWISKDEKRQELYKASLSARVEWEIESILEELKGIALVDIRDAYDNKNALLPIQDMPKEVARCIESIETTEIYEGRGEEKELSGYTKKVKFGSKIAALQLLAKKLHLLKEQADSGKMTLEDLLAESRKDA